MPKVDALIDALGGGSVNLSAPDIGGRIKTARKALGMTQGALAMVAGARSKSGLQDNEAGKNIPGGQMIAALVHVGINANWLLTGEGPMLLAERTPPLAVQESESAYAVVTRPVIGAREDQLKGPQRTIGQQLTCWRLGFGITEIEAAARLNVPLSEYQKYETDQGSPDIEALMRFVEAGINANWLLSNEGPVLLRDLQPQAPRINIEALTAILEGALKAAPGAPMGQIARHSVEFYVRCIEDGLITPDGIGEGKHGTAA